MAENSGHNLLSISGAQSVAPTSPFPLCDKIVALDHDRNSPEPVLETKTEERRGRVL